MTAPAVGVSRSVNPSVNSKPAPHPLESRGLDTEGLFAPQRVRLTKLLRRRCRTPDEIEDLIQDAFVRLQVYLNQGNEVREPEAFLVRTILNLSIDARRKDRRELYVAEPFEDLDLIDIEPAPDEALAAIQRLHRICEVLYTKLNPKTRDIYLRSRLEGCTHKEIAKELQMSVRAVGKHIARAMALIAAERKKEQAATEGERAKDVRSFQNMKPSHGSSRQINPIRAAE